MNKFLQNIKQDQQLKKDGFLKVSFLPPDCIAQIKALYEETRLEHEKIGKLQAFHATQDCANVELTKYVDKRAKEILTPFIEKNFVNYTIIMANFILKSPGEASSLTPHQDWTFVDESKYATYGFWTPIEDTSAENGNLQFLPESHKIEKTLRVNYNYPCAFSEVLDLAKENLVEVFTKKGESVILNHAVLHGSRPNLSSGTRVALTLGLTQKDAQLYHYYCEDGKTVHRYKINLEILEGLKYQVKPSDEFLDGVFKFDFPVISKAKFLDWLNRSI
jgi:ectoine hydroxylase-related dioxygenase (phytanoyl-CoA dioxygenase family)